MKPIKFIHLSLLSISILSCELEFDKPNTESLQNELTQGLADFTNYVAIGNSLTAGYRDGALFIKGQKTAFPTLLAKQLSQVGGNEFKIPYMNDNTGGMVLQTNTIFPARYTLGVNPETGSPTAVRINTLPTTQISEILEGNFNNMGIPGIKSFHVNAKGYGNIANLPNRANPYFVRMAQSPNSSIMGDILAQKPTFFTYWIGNNDILSYATSGGVNPNGTPAQDHNQTGNIDPSSYQSNDITHSGVFQNAITQQLNEIQALDNFGVIINIADIKSLPYFTTIPSKPFSETALSSQNIQALNTAYAPYNKALEQFQIQGVISKEEQEKRQIIFTENTINGTVIEDKTLTDLSALNVKNWRMSTKKDLILITAASKIPTSTQIPLTDNYVLIPSEQQAIVTATQQYNQTLKEYVTAHNQTNKNQWIYYDIAATLKQLASEGLQSSDRRIFSNFISGGSFSLDGIHTTPRGNAVICNEIIDLLEATYKCKISRVDSGLLESVPLN